MTYTLIAHQELTSSQASITFSSIPQTFTDLFLVTSLRTSVSNVGDYAVAAFNGSTSSFTSRVLFGTGSSTGSSAWSGLDGRIVAQAVGNTATSNTFSNSSLYIPNYAGGANKSFSVDAIRENNATAAEQVIVAGLWSNTAAITSITLTVYTGGNFLSGSSATLYGITAGSSGGVVVS